MFPRLCNAIGLPELIQHPDYLDFKLRSKNRASAQRGDRGEGRQRPGADWVELLNKAGVPCGQINIIDQMFADPQVQHLGLAQSVEHPTLGRLNLVAQGVNVGSTKPPRLRMATPERGQHNDEVLREFGYSDAEIKAFREKKVI